MQSGLECVEVGLLRCVDVSVKRDGVPLFKPVTFELGPGQVVTLLGASGLGKSTFLHALVMAEPGVEISGEVSLDGRPIDPDARFASLSQTVFQDALLFPHLSIRDNVGLSLHGWSREKRLEAVDDILDAVGLGTLQTSDPYALSRGQMMRVSIARALVRPPTLLLLDEPFSALDANTRDTVRDVVFERARLAGSHVILVTHSEDDRPISDSGQVLCLTRS